MFQLGLFLWIIVFFSVVNKVYLTSLGMRGLGDLVRIGCKSHLHGTCMK